MESGQARAYYQAALSALAYIEARQPTGRRFGAEADARWSSFKGDLSTADRIDLLIRDADAQWPSAFGARTVFAKRAVAEDEPFGADWEPLHPVEANDLDLAVAVGMEDFPGSLVAWRRHPKMEHRFFSTDGQMVDVLPAGRELIEQGYIEWSGGERMSLLGFDLAFAHHTTVEAGGTSLLVPTAPVVAFLKMRAWLDQPEVRQKDLGDLAHLLVGYVQGDDDRRFEDEIFDLGLDFEDISPFLLGRDLAQIIGATHRAHVIEFLDRASAEALAAHGPPGWSSAEHAERAIASFRQGLQD